MDNTSVPPRLSFVCPKRWESMQTDGPQRRFCEECQLHVHDLSAMSVATAERFVAAARGQVCVSYMVRPDGSMVTNGRWSTLGKPWAIVRRGIFALLAVAAPLWFTACTDDKAGCSRLGGSMVVGGDGKDAPPAATPRPIRDRLTGRTGRP